MYLLTWSFSIFGMYFLYDESPYLFLSSASAAYVCQHFKYNIVIIVNCILSFIGNATNTTDQYQMYHIIATILSYVFGIIIYCLFFLFINKYSKKHNLKNVYRPALVYVSIGTLVVVLLFNMFRNALLSHSDAKLHLLISFLLLVICTFILSTILMIFNRTELETEKQLLEATLKKEENQYQLKKGYIDLINIKCHDIKHLIKHAENNKGLLTNNEINQLKDNVNSLSTQISTGNETLDVVLNDYKLQIEKYNIDFTCIVDGSILDFMSLSDICSLFGNIMENALAATSTVKKKEYAFIILNVKKQNGVILIDEENGFDSKLNIDSKGNILTSKDDKNFHGFGLKSIKYIAEKYSGSTAIESENNRFHLSISMINQQQNSTK